MLVPSAFTLQVRSGYRYGGPAYAIRGTLTFNDDDRNSKTVREATLTLKRCADQSAGKKCKA